MATSKLPRNFNKMSLSEQESILIKKLHEIREVEEQIVKALAKVRGGQRYIAIEPRPDEILLK